VAKCSTPTPPGHFTIVPPKTEIPSATVDVATWVSQVNTLHHAHRKHPLRLISFSITHFDSTIDNKCALSQTLITSFDRLNVTTKDNTDMKLVMKVMAEPYSGLDIRERKWFKMIIPNAFIGGEMVDWLYHHVEGFPDRKNAYKYAANMLKNGYGLTQNFIFYIKSIIIWSIINLKVIFVNRTRREVSAKNAITYLAINVTIK
jgi:segment polarity protein dishevelled